MWWQWIKSTIFKPVANFFSGIAASIRHFFISDPQPAERQPLLQDAPNIAAASSAAILQTVVVPAKSALPKSVKYITLHPGQSFPKLKDMAFDVLAKNNLFTLETLADVAVKERVQGVIFQNILEKLMPDFLKAIFNDDREKVTKILDKNPELLLVKAQGNTNIETKYWVTFDVENKDALSIAAKFHQIKMVDLLLPYYKKLEQTYQDDPEYIAEINKAREEALSAWNMYETRVVKNENGEDEIEIVIPPLYANYAKSLIDVFTTETFLNGTNGTNGAFSEKAENGLKLLFNILQPDKPVKVDDYIDAELMLLAFYQAYRDQFNTFQNWEQRDAFCVRMIGLAQSVLTPETAKIFCEGLYYVVEENRKISERAASLKLLDGESFYRASRESRSGLGIEYLCGAGAFAGGGRVAGVGVRAAAILEKLCRAKATNFRNITQQLQQQPHRHHADRKQSGCVIL